MKHLSVPRAAAPYCHKPAATLSFYLRIRIRDTADDKASLIGLRDKILRAPEGEHAAQADEITQMRRLSAAPSRGPKALARGNVCRFARHPVGCTSRCSARLLGRERIFPCVVASKHRTPTGRENAILYPAQRGAGAGARRSIVGGLLAGTNPGQLWPQWSPEQSHTRPSNKCPASPICIGKGR
jgi:hypothetical protein